MAQLSIKDRCAQHHWSLSSTTVKGSVRETLSMLVPEVLVQMEEGAQNRNIHRVYLEYQDENVDTNTTTTTKGKKSTIRSRVKLSKQK